MWHYVTEGEGSKSPQKVWQFLNGPLPGEWASEWVSSFVTPFTGWDFSAESDGAGSDLIVSLEWDVAADHVVEQDAQRPHGARVAFIDAELNPLRRTVHSRTCTTPSRIHCKGEGKGPHGSLWIGNPSQSYGASPAIRDHPTQVNAPRLNPSHAGDLPTPEGWKAELTVVVGYIPR